MLSRTLCSAPFVTGLRPVAAWQASALLSLGLGSLTLALAQAPLAAAPQGAVLAAANEALEALAPAQGLPLNPPTALGWLNPGADVDASVSTDGEDIAAPVADVAEFRSKDAFLAVDALFGGAAAANAAAAGGAAVLATALAQDYL